MSIADRIKDKLNTNISIKHLKVEDNSHKHIGHQGWKKGGQTHFDVTIISPDFKGKSKIARHKMIYSILKEEMDKKIHALSITAQTPEEQKTLRTKN